MLEFDSARVEMFATMRHRQLPIKDRSLLRADPMDVAKLAERLARLFFQRQYGDEAESADGVARSAGCLIYAMECYGCNYESICDLADYSVARIVAAVSSDNRLPGGKRGLMLRASVAKSDALCQIVKLAELTCVCRRLLVASGLDLVKHHVDIKRWVDDHEAVRDAMNVLKSSEVMATHLEGAKQLLVRVAAAVDRARQEVREQRRARRAAAALEALGALAAPLAQSEPVAVLA